MVLESLVSVKDALRNPWHMIGFGVIVSLVSILVSYTIFPDSVGLVTVSMITIISAPLMAGILRYEEWSEEKALSLSSRLDPIQLFIRHKEIFLVYSAFFFGIVLALSAAFIFLPASLSQQIFDYQVSEIGKIGQALGSFTAGGAFYQIFANNALVMSISFAFALLFGVGAIFILAWNASVLSAAIGIVTNSSGVANAIATFLPHGVFEIAAYFMAAISGGIVSVAVSKRGTKAFGPIFLDSIFMILIAFILIAIGAFIESLSFV